MKIDRRSFIRHCTACAGGLALNRVLGQHTRVALADSLCSSNRRCVVTILMAGGPHSPSILVPRNTSSYFSTHPRLGIQNSLVLDAIHGLHPRMLNLFSLYQQGKVNISNGASYPNSSLSHQGASDFLGRAASGAAGGSAYSSGWIGRFVQNYCSPEDEFAMMSFAGPTAEMLSAGAEPVVISDLQSYEPYYSFYPPTIMTEQVNHDNRFLWPLNSPAAHLMKNAWEQFTERRQTLLQVYHSYQSTVLYPSTYIGQQMKDVGRLLTSSLVSPKHILLSAGSYDSHSSQNTLLPRSLEELDGAIGALWSDLERVGRTDDIVIQAYGEFGRTHERITSDTPAAEAGTDHGRGGIYILIGNRVRAGIGSPAYTEGDFVGANAGDFPFKFDFREALEQVIARHLDVDPALVLPEQINRIGLSLFV